MSGDTIEPELPAATGRWVTVQRFYNEFEAEVCGTRLAAESIPFLILNGTTRTTLAMYGSMVNVDLQVPEADVDRARAVIAQLIQQPLADDRLVPAHADDPAVPFDTVSETGEAARLLAAGVFPTVHALRAAIGTLDASGIDSFPPELVEPSSDGTHENVLYVLRVREADIERARPLVRPAVDVAGDVELCCPRCGGWKIFEMNHEIKNMMLGFIGRAKPPECECLTCHFAGPRAEFEGDTAAGKSN